MATTCVTMPVIRVFSNTLTQQITVSHVEPYAGPVLLLIQLVQDVIRVKIESYRVINVSVILMAASTMTDLAILAHTAIILARPVMEEHLQTASHVIQLLSVIKWSTLARVKLATTTGELPFA